MNIIVLDTETTGLEKPFCYNLGYVVYNTVTDKILKSNDFVIEQIWHNLPLFNTAYYADKRELYIASMRGKTSQLEKFGYVTQKLRNDIKFFNVQGIYAYNSPFDDRVLQFNCDWFKVIHPFETIPVFDIRGYVHQIIALTSEYQAFADMHELYTESGNYSTTAESIYKYISQNETFIEDHTALSDAKIELAILKYCVERGAVYNTQYEVYKSITKLRHTPYTVKVNGKIIHTGQYTKKYVRDTLFSFTEEG